MADLKFSVIQNGNIDISSDKGVQDSRPSCSLLQLGSINILIDLGHPQEDPADITDGLKKYGLTPADIQYVFFTHLHPDHIGHKNLFSGSTFVFHKDEKMAFVFKNDKTIALSESSIFGITENSIAGPMRSKTVPDFNKLGNSIYFHHCPGHTPGSMTIFTNIENKIHAFVGDIFLSEEYFRKMILPGSTWDETPIPAQMEFIKVNADIIIPGHGKPFEVNR